MRSLWLVAKGKSFPLKEGPEWTGSRILFVFSSNIAREPLHIISRTALKQAIA